MPGRAPQGSEMAAGRKRRTVDALRRMGTRKEAGPNVRPSRNGSGAALSPAAGRRLSIPC